MMVRIRPLARRDLKHPNYLVFWREHTDHVEILRILHGMQHLPRFFRRKH